MNAIEMGNGLNRSVKLAIDSGEAATFEEASKIFEQYKLRISVGSDIAFSPTLQAALLTAVNTARRCFLGGVEVIGCPDATLLIPWKQCHRIAEAVENLQGKTVRATPSDAPLIVIGDAIIRDQESEFAIRATFDGWRGGVIPLNDGRLEERQEFTPAGVLAGALSVSEAFQFVRGHNAQAGRRDVGLSLWRPDSEHSWLNDLELGPELEWLPKKLWLIGLGHLGQAYLWTLGLLPYANPSEVSLVLQDYDSLVPANDSTSPLTDETLIGQKKTRAMAAWCEQRGFRTRIQERRFAANFRIDDEEPHVALCGVDNEAARAALEDVGFEQVIEAGLGLGTEEYLAFQMHSFPASRSARLRWGRSSVLSQADSILSRPAYQSLASKGIDQCGLTMLAGRSVGAAFVGAATSALVIAELLRMCAGEHRYEVIDGSLRAFEHRLAVPSEVLASPFNPGLSKAQAYEMLLVTV
jgi:hypothetical protein